MVEEHDARRTVAEAQADMRDPVDREDLGPGAEALKEKFGEVGGTGGDRVFVGRRSLEGDDTCDVGEQVRQALLGVADEVRGLRGGFHRGRHVADSTAAPRPGGQLSGSHSGATASASRRKSRGGRPQQAMSVVCLRHG